MWALIPHKQQFRCINHKLVVSQYLEIVAIATIWFGMKLSETTIPSVLKKISENKYSKYRTSYFDKI